MMEGLDGMEFEVNGATFKVVKETECGLYTIKTNNEEINKLQRENLKSILYARKCEEIGDEETTIKMNKEIYENALKLAQYFDSLGLKVMAKAHYISACDSAIEGKLLKESRKIISDMAKRSDLTDLDLERLTMLDMKWKCMPERFEF